MIKKKYSIPLFHTKTYIWLLYLLVGFLFIGCSNESSNKFASKPNALGKRNKITVIADKNLWDGPIQDSFNFYFGASYPIMPQPEPLFDIRHFSVEDLNNEPLRRHLRTYVVLSNLGDKESRTTKMLIKDLGEKQYQEALLPDGKTVSAGVDKWANKQLIVYLYGKNEAELAQSIKNNFPKVAKRINQHDSEQLASNTYGFKIHQVHTQAVKDRYDINVNIPGDYQQATFDSINNVSWFRKDTKTAKLNLIFQREKYKNTNQFSKDYIIKKRDDFGKKYVSSSAEGSYMKTNVVDLPIYEYDQVYGDMQTKEVRGIWEMENDFLGGPYISYAVYNKSRGEIIYIDCFVMNIGKDKRDLMQEIEYIVSSMPK